MRDTAKIPNSVTSKIMPNKSCLALKTGKSKASAGILLVGAMGQLVLAPTKMTGPVIAIGIASPTVGPIPLLGYFESFWVNAPVFLEYILLIFICTKIFKPDTPINGTDQQNTGTGFAFSSFQRQTDPIA